MTVPTPQDRRRRLFELLPPLYRALDEAQAPESPAGEGPTPERLAGPLEQWLQVINEQANLLEDDLRRWYDNWFIETCEDWVVPYIGDLIGYRAAGAAASPPAAADGAPILSPRREVANTIRLRRRKGTLAMLEELSREVAGWPARAVEFRRFVAGTASLRVAGHSRQRRARTISVRRVADLQNLGTPCDRLPRTVDVRRLNSSKTRGRFNLPAVGLFVYRRQVLSATLAPAGQLAPERRFFDPLALDVPLHILCEPERSTATLTTVENLPLPLSRRSLAADLANIGKDHTTAQHFPRPRHKRSKPENESRFYGVGQSLAVFARWDTWQLLPSDRIRVADLSQWQFAWSRENCHLVALDPELGRLMFHPDHPPLEVRTNYHYGATAKLGGGEYERRLEPAERTIRVGEDETFATLDAAIESWLSAAERPRQIVIEITDGGSYDASFEITIPANHGLEVRAANQVRPVLRGTSSGWRITAESGVSLVLDGLWLAAGELRLSGPFAKVTIRHCTLSPARVRLLVACNETVLRIERSILGPIESRQPRCAPPDEQAPAASANGEPIRLLISDSIVDSRGGDGPCSAPGPSAGDAAILAARPGAEAILSLVRSTVFGRVAVRSVALIENSICRDPIVVEDCQRGCIRFSFLAQGSSTPPPFHCQPPRTSLATALPAVIVSPRFIATAWPHPDYARLTDDCPREIARGADDQAEMGVYHDEFLTRRADALRIRLDEFAPADCNSDILFET